MGQRKVTTRIETVRRRTSDDRDSHGAYSGTYDLATYVDGELSGPASEGITEEAELEAAGRLVAGTANDVDFSRYELNGTGEFFFTFAAFGSGECVSLAAL